MSKKSTVKETNWLEEIYKSSLRFLMPLSIEQTYKVFMEEILKLADGEHGSILLEKNGKMQRVYSSSPFLYEVKPRYKGYTHKVKSSKSYRVLKIEQLEKIHPEFKKAKVKYDMIVPLLNRNKAIGVFTILAKHKFTKKQIDLVQLFSPLGTLAIKKAQLYEEIKKEIDTRDLFISLASHELRTPITSSYMHLQLIERNYLKNRPFDIKWVITLQNEMERLSSIINELLELDQIRSGKLSYNWQECDIEKILERAFISFEAKYNGRQIQKINKLPSKRPVIIGDLNKLIGVFINLLDNAAKHSEENKPIKVKLSVDKKYVSVIIEDKGSGIPKKDLGKIFDDFYKAEGNTKPGMGLGLYLAKQIIEKHKGKLNVDSELGVGTSVKIEIPLLKI